MADMLRNRLAELKQQLGNYDPVGDDYDESEDIAELDTEILFQYFRGELDAKTEEQVDVRANKSKLFLYDLIRIGELMATDTAAGHEPTFLSWADLSGLGSLGAESRTVTLESAGGTTLDLGSTHLMAADSGDRETLCEVPKGTKGTVFVDGEELVIKITSEMPEFDGQLMGFCLSSSEEDSLGFVLLRSGVLGNAAGTIRLDRTKFPGEQRLTFCNVDASDLSNADLPQLEEAVARDLDDERSMNAWRRWIDIVAESDDGPGLSPTIERLREIAAKS